MSNIINFRAISKTHYEIQPKPYPAIKSLPKWFLDAGPYLTIGDFPKDGRLHVRNTESSASFKKCTPLLDGMSAGYIIPLWAGVELDTLNKENPHIYWRTRHDVFEMHSLTTKDIETPPGYCKQIFKYKNCWIPQTPNGYSCLVISPIGHNDLPFKTVPAIIDTDKSTMEIALPVWAKSDFQGIVEKNTPIAQIIPFKRDNWESTFDYYQDGEYYNVIEEKNFRSTIISHYIKNHWSKKTFK